MHIAWLGKKSPFCGNVTYSREVTSALLDRGHRVSFLHFAQPGECQNAPLHHRLSYQEISLPFFYKSQLYTIPTPGSSRKLSKTLARLKPDVVHASLTLSPLDFSLPDLCESLRLPLVATFHPPFDRRRRNLTSGTQHFAYQVYASCLTRYDRVVVFSELQRSLLSQLGVDRARLAVIPNGVDVQKYSPGSSRFREEIKAEQIFIYQGRVAIEKNVEALLKAWKQSEMGSGCKLVILGDGPLRSSLEPFYTAEDGILWLGSISDEARRIDILRGCDVFILPSLVEGLSLSLLEAMACGLACVATDAGADGEVLEHEAGVILSTEGVTAQLKTLLPQLKAHPRWVALMGQKARQRVLERYTLSRNITQLEMLYRQVLRSQVLQVSQC